MKKLFILALAAVMTAGCTTNMMTRKWGGRQTINLPRGRKLVEVTWKDNNLWILTEPMDSGYVPKTKTFYEDSSWELLEGVITIVESR